MKANTLYIFRKGKKKNESLYNRQLQKQLSMAFGQK